MGCLLAALLIGLVMGIKAGLVMLLWNIVLIGWLGLGLPTMSFGIALIVAFVLQMLFGGNK